MTNYAIITPTSCTNLSASTFTFCLPIRQECDTTPTDGLLTECNLKWNCTYCQADRPYFTPYVLGDVIQIQTLFFDDFNADRQNPTDGFGSWIIATFCGLNEDGTTVETTALPSFSSRNMVAWGCGKSYQIIEIDTSLFPDVCKWSLKFEVMNGSGIQEELCTNEFEKIDDALCADTVTVQGKHVGTDCWGFCYEVPDAFQGDLILYNNQIRFKGYIKNTGGTFQKNTTGSRVSSTTLQDIYTFQLGEKIPAYAKNILLKQLLTADLICVDGEDYELDNFTVSNQIEKGTMFLFGVELYTECENKKNCL